MNIDKNAVRQRALIEFRNEMFERAVAGEKAKMLAQASTKKTSLWQRLLNKLPFTITRKQKS